MNFFKLGIISAAVSLYACNVFASVTIGGTRIIL
ncbi:Uncharacterised protein [Kluyvera cryocrescens]|uniref:Uncharacterized protein n=1 Tax=Kluyvera cryocrescens TaxID=580 RepID=A0A485A1X7_KLUCR|nr:Uncharacterised protein [Kluyvera cryocrescens]